jgi:hypothetical protein
MIKHKQKLLSVSCVTILVAAAAWIVFGFSREEQPPQRPMKLEELQSYIDQPDTKAYVKRLTCVFKENDASCPYLLVRLVSPDCEGRISLEELAAVPPASSRWKAQPGEMIRTNLWLILHQAAGKGIDFQICRPNDLAVFAKVCVRNDRRTKAFNDGSDAISRMSNAKFPIEPAKWELHWSDTPNRKWCRQLPRVNGRIVRSAAQ